MHCHYNTRVSINYKKWFFLERPKRQKLFFCRPPSRLNEIISIYCAIAISLPGYPPTNHISYAVVEFETYQLALHNDNDDVFTFQKQFQLSRFLYSIVVTMFVYQKKFTTVHTTQAQVAVSISSKFDGRFGIFRHHIPDWHHTHDHKRNFDSFPYCLSVTSSTALAIFLAAIYRECLHGTSNEIWVTIVHMERTQQGNALPSLLQNTALNLHFSWLLFNLSPILTGATLMALSYQRKLLPSYNSSCNFEGLK